MRYMLDSSVCIAVMRDRPHALLARLERQPVGDIGVSAIVMAELEAGVSLSARTNDNRAALAEFITYVAPLDWPLAAIPAYAQARAELDRKGQRIGGLDLLIAAHALYAKTILVTDNEREFRRVPGLRVENWLKA